ncbi:MAG: hypothetical protein JO359_15715 [Candidatus Eremiobacteraeota bacterium]|nr:hypothetical protein [Candidatus Eremiobacteraeota bacterium]
MPMPLRTRLLSLLLVLAFGGCAGGSQTLGSMNGQSTAPPVVAGGQNLIRATLGIKTIPPGATTITVYVVQTSSGPNVPQFFPVATCVSLTAPGVGPSNVPFAVPVGIDWIVVAASSGTCAAATTLPGTVVTAVQTAISNGAFALPTSGAVTAATLPTVQVAGTAATGTVSTIRSAGIAGNPFTLNPGGAVALGPVALGYPLASTQTLVGASLSTVTAGLTSFEMDAGGNYALPFYITFNGTAGSGPIPPSASSCNPVTGAGGGCNAFDANINVRLKDTSITASGGAAPGFLGVSLVSSTGVVLGAVFTTLGSAGCSATQACANLPLVAVPPTGSMMVVQYAGLTQDFFQTASVTVTANGATLASFNVTNQTQVATIVTAGSGGTPPGAGVIGPLGVEWIAPFALGVTETADNTGTATGGRIVQNTLLAPFAGNTSTVGASAAVANTLFGAVAGDKVSIGPFYFADANCVGCSAAPGGAYGFYSLNVGFPPATVPSAVTTAGAASPPFQSTVLPPFKTGPVGLAFLPAGIAGVSDAATCQVAGCASGVLYFAANNSIYRAELSAATTVAYYALVAGTGQAGAAGQGQVYSNGLASKFNFGTVPFLGMTTDRTNAAPGVATNLYFVDAGNGAIVKVALAPPNAVTMVTPAAKAVGLTYDVNNGQLYASNSDATITAISPATGAVTTYAGLSGSPGRSDGLGLKPYPLQFNANNAVSQAGGGAPPAGTPFGALGLTANTNAAAQAAAGVNAFVGRFNNPQGISYEPTGYLWVVDNATPALRVLF